MKHTLLVNIKRLCQEQGTTLRSLEKALDIGNGAIAKWEHRSPRVGTVKKVADYFGVTVDELISYSKKDGKHGTD